MQNKRVVFMGTPDYADKILDKLVNSDYEIVLVLTQPDKPVGRKKVMTPPPVKIRAIDLGLRLLQPKTLKDEEITNIIKDSNPNFIVVAAYGQILPKAILDIAPCINLHASILPEYRGASPVQQVLLDGKEYSGVTAMLMDEGLDTGDILAYTKSKIPSNMRLSELMNTLSNEASDLTITVLDRFDEIEPIPQINAQSSHCKKISRKDGEILLDDASKIYNKFRAFENWPGIFLSNGLKFTDISIANIDNIYDEDGKILEISKKGVTISCKRGAITIHKIHPQSKKEIDAKAYIAGKRLELGDNIF